MERRSFLLAMGAAPLMRAANDRIRLGFIGTGRMGIKNLQAALQVGGVEIVSLCDVYAPNLEWAVKEAKAGKQSPRAERDFRRILADSSIDAVCISTPDHWHAYMTVEACKAGKDVFIEKPLCTSIDEGRMMVAATRKYKRVVQVGTLQRSGTHYRHAVQLIRSGALGPISMTRAWNYTNEKPLDHYADSAPPADLDWDLWLGPAPERPFNANRFGVFPDAWSHFRLYRDYAGGMITDWGVHHMDLVQCAFDEAMPNAVVALGRKFILQDDRDTPDTVQVTFEYPHFLGSFENRLTNGQSFGPDQGLAFHGQLGTAVVNREYFEVIPEPGASFPRRKEEASNDLNAAHWANFLECMRSRRDPVSSIETGFRSTAACQMANISLVAKARVDWDDRAQTIVQSELRKYMHREYRSPWKLEL
jgi:predicted dehydrogenase